MSPAASNRRRMTQGTRGTLSEKPARVCGRAPAVCPGLSRSGPRPTRAISRRAFRTAPAAVWCGRRRFVRGQAQPGTGSRTFRPGPGRALHHERPPPGPCPAARGPRSGVHEPAPVGASYLFVHKAMQRLPRGDLATPPEREDREAAADSRSACRGTSGSLLL